MPSEQQETRLGELAKQLDEDVAIIRDDFTAFVGMQSWAASTDSWNVELWPDPVETQKLLQKISAKIRKYIVLRPEAVIATALWTMTAWAHEGATHSPILAAISVEPDSGKSTLLGVLRFLVPKPFVSVEPTGPSVYRTVDREHPTLIIDAADDLFYRKSDLRAIVNAGWSRGTRIPRQGRWYDPFCPKILGILGKTKLPRTIASRSIILRMWPKKPDEKAEDFAYADDPEFSTIRRKLARWAADNVRIIKDLKPPQPPGFNNRLNANWKLLLQIAQHAGGGWPEQACRSAIYLSRAPYEPSVGVQLLAVLRSTFTKNRTEITSEQVVQELVADPDSPWHEYRGRGPITKNQVAALLRDYDIRPVVVHPTKVSRGTVIGPRNSRTRLRVSCLTSRTSEHSRAGARGCDVRMFATGWAAPRRQSACRTADVLAFKSHNLDATIFWFRAPNFGDPAPAASPILRVIVAHRTDAASLKIA